MRVYLPLTVAGLGELHRTGRASGSPLRAHAVTSALRASFGTADDEELEYAALMAAAYDSLLAIASTGGEPRRVVVSADLDDAAVAPDPDADDDPTAVVVTGEVGLERCRSVHVDDADAEGEIVLALARLPEAQAGDGQALAAVSLVEHELMWFATQEIPDLLG
ncbi:MAG TPA: hypothetical protein VFL59_13535 [Candidatus Nanopelagicales bacterium]|nr:hypothetical protein [Candidatus Nanopelagicales bacterium]